jgi:hypothetical protein
VDTGDTQRADVYIRDNPSDVGGNTSCSDFSSTGDVVVLTEAVRAASFPDLVQGVTTAGSSADLAFSAARDAPLSSTNVSRGTDNWLFIRVVNLGPNTAFGVRVTAALAAFSTTYLYPRDWEVVTVGETVGGRPVVVGDDYAHELPNAGIFIVRLRIPAGADYTGFASNRACALARVLACNDVTFLRTAPVTDTGDQQQTRNNLAQRNMSLVV